MKIDQYKFSRIKKNQESSNLHKYTDIINSVS